MASTYLIRFDDISPTMNWPVWQAIERVLHEEDLRPILAVVPDNQDPKLCVNAAEPHFWDRVRQWQARGWTIGLHGYQHVYVTQDAGIVGLNRRSEFAGLDVREQEHKLRKAVEIFKSEGVRPDIWVAPAHSFDQETLSILRDLSVGVVSDGFSLFPHVDPSGIVCLPQQLWRFRPMPIGVWTVCFHHNHWDQHDLAAFQKGVKEYRASIEDTNAVLVRFRGRRRTWYDSVFASAWLVTLRAKRRVRPAQGAADD